MMNPKLCLMSSPVSGFSYSHFQDQLTKIQQPRVWIFIFSFSGPVNQDSEEEEETTAWRDRGRIRKKQFCLLPTVAVWDNSSLAIQVFQASLN